VLLAAFLIVGAGLWLVTESWWPGIVVMVLGVGFEFARDKWSE
jgi:hypothetical protein